MKKSAIAITLFLAFALAGVAHAFGGGFGMEPQGEFRKIGSAARQVLQDYLAEEYKHDCPAKKGKALPEACHLTPPIYAGEALPDTVSYELLPADVLKKLNFVPPGKLYVQIGYTVYLISWPRKIIFDDVTLEGQGSEGASSK